MVGTAPASSEAAPGEPEGVIARLLGLPPLDLRPSVDAGIFDDETRLRVVAYENDGSILLSEIPGLYTHLTGDAHLNCFVGVLGDGTTHAYQITDPAGLVAAIDAFDDRECDGDDDEDDDDEDDDDEDD